MLPSLSKLELSSIGGAETRRARTLATERRNVFLEPLLQHYLTRARSFFSAFLFELAVDEMKAYIVICTRAKAVSISCGEDAAKAICIDLGLLPFRSMAPFNELNDKFESEVVDRERAMYYFDQMMDVYRASFDNISIGDVVTSVVDLESNQIASWESLLRYCLKNFSTTPRTPIRMLEKKFQFLIQIPLLGDLNEPSDVLSKYRARRNWANTIRDQRSLYLDILPAFANSMIGSNRSKLVQAGIVLYNLKEAVLEAVQVEGAVFQYASSSLRDDRQVAVAAIENDWQAFQHASQRLRKDKDFVLFAVSFDQEDSGNVLKYAPSLQDDADVARRAVRRTGDALQYASGRLRDSKSFLLQVANKLGNGLRHASVEMRSDEEVVRNVVLFAQDAAPLEFANDRIKINRKLMLLMATDTPGVLSFANLELTGNLDFLKDVLRAQPLRVGEVAEIASRFHTQDKGYLISMAVDSVGFTLADCDDQGRNDVEVCLAAVKKNGFELEYGSDDVKANEGVVFEAVSQSGLALQFADDDLKDDDYIVQAAFANNRNSLMYAFMDAVKSVVSQDGMFLEYAGEDERNQEEVVLAAVLNNGLALQFADDRLRREPDIVRAAVGQNINAQEFALVEISEYPESPGYEPESPDYTPGYEPTSPAWDPTLPPPWMD